MLVVQNWQRNFFFKKFSSESIYRDVKCNFFKPAEKSLPESRFFSSLSPKKNWNRKDIFAKRFSSKCSYGHVEYTIDNPFEKIDK